MTAMKVACCHVMLCLAVNAGEVVEGNLCVQSDCGMQETAGSTMLQFERSDISRIHKNELNKTNHTTPLHVFVHLADPQLGMFTQYAPNPTEWNEEFKEFSSLVGKAKGIKPKFLFVGGDMQNYWPNEPTDKNRNSPEAQKKVSGEDLGYHQREDVKKAMKVGEELPVHYTAGNHDVGDQPDADTMEMYTKNWGEHHHEVLKDQGILYVQINSQLYQAEEKDDLKTYRKKQEDFLDEQLKNVDDKTKLVVVMTHIPPFFDAVDEKEGWGNWKKKHRTHVLDKFSLKSKEHKFDLLFVCGHFHANVEQKVKHGGMDVYIRVTSSAGTPMNWGGKSELDPPAAAVVAAKTAKEAFDQDILGGLPFPEALEIKKQRYFPSETRSGLRVFKVYEDGKFEDKWYTLTNVPAVALLQGDQLDRKR